MMQPARFLIVLGIVLVAAGLALLVWDKIPGLRGFLGRLPGDIVVERPGFRVYIPLTTCLLVSVVVSFVLYLWRK